MWKGNSAVYNSIWLFAKHLKPINIMQELVYSSSEFINTFKSSQTALKQHSNSSQTVVKQQPNSTQIAVKQ